MGSAGFAVPSLQALLQSKHEILEVVTQPDKPAGRGRHITPCPTAQFAKEHDLILYQPKSVKKAEAIDHLKNLAPDLIAIVAYGKILPKAILDLPQMGCVNVHSSLLPKYRGAAPINWAIVNGETETGVTTMRINEEMDAGDILLACKTQIDETEDAILLHDRLAPLGAELLLKTLDGIEDNSIKQLPQDHSQASYARIIKKEDGHIDWSKGADEIYNMMRGFKPWPGTYTSLDGKMFRIHEAAPHLEDSKHPAGSIIENDNYIAVACGKGVLFLIEVQIEGKKRMSATDFLKGHKIEKGTVLR
ncbi:MAG: methionyl-tRNA formyltransferase [Deltaproteobacteria bacterium]|nr:methionyl-tRNA formyltransferase [Deltaproteobacteria bacterium]